MSGKFMTTRWGTLGLAFSLLLAFGLFGLGGCSDNAVTTNVTGGFDEEDARDNLIEADIVRHCYEYEAFAKSGDDPEEEDTVVVPPYLQASGSAEYDDDGFTIRLDFGFEGLQVVFEFPEDAVSEESEGILYDSDDEITITGEAVYCNGSYTFFYECGPSGLVFDKPVILDQGVDERNFVPMGLFFNVHGPWYTLEEVSFVRNGLVVFHIWHFSKYGISR